MMTAPDSNGMEAMDMSKFAWTISEATMNLKFIDGVLHQGYILRTGELVETAWYPVPHEGNPTP